MIFMKAKRLFGFSRKGFLFCGILFYGGVLFYDGMYYCW